MKQNEILVTGGTGMIGTALKKVLPNANFISSKEFDLREKTDTNKMLTAYNPKYIIHLAAKVGGVKANSDYVADFYSENYLINHNVLAGAKEIKTKKVISVLSTCVYPDSMYVDHPLTESQLHLGPPHHSNFGYAYSKRMVDVMSRAYRQQYNCNFITAIPNNLYGENDNFHLQDSHVIPALIRKIWEAKIQDKTYVECWGDGRPMREFTYSEDMANILVYLLKNYNEAEPINIGNTTEYCISEVVSMICKIFEYNGDIVWRTDNPAGQYRKPSSNKKLLNLGWKKEDYTPLNIGLKKTCDWFKINYPKVRGF